MKKLVVLGATGGTGLEIVRQAIELGHSVTAFVRSPQRLNSLRSSMPERITMVETEDEGATRDVDSPADLGPHPQ